MCMKSDQLDFLMTEAASCLVNSADMAAAVRRHLAGDWGEISPAVRTKNERASVTGGSVFSVHLDRDGIIFYVSSEAKQVPRVFLSGERHL